MPGLDETDNEFRWRLQEPSLFDPDSFKRKNITEGIDLILGKKKSGDGSMEAQAIRFGKDKFDKEQAKKWVEEHKGKFACDEKTQQEYIEYAQPETFDINDVQIFASGEWNGDKYSLDDIDNIVNAFNQTKDILKPYLKLGHDENQKLIQNSGMPAIGWIDNLKRVGNKLIASFTKLPKKIYELIKKGAYRRISSEIFWNIKIGNKAYPKALKAVSLLGADTPAVETLDDILSLYAINDEISINQENIKIYNIEREELETMDKIKELEEKIVELTKVIEVKEAEIVKIAEEKSKLETTVKENELKAINKEIEMIVDKFISDKHLNPADKDKAIQKLTALRLLPEQKKFKIGEKELSLYEMEIEDIGKYSIKLNTEENSEMGTNASKEDNSDLAEKANKYAKEKNVSYKEALQTISRESK